MLAHPDVKVIGSNTTGNDHIDFDACEKHGVKVITLGLQPNRDGETEWFLDTITSTAEHTIGLMIALARNYKTAFNGVPSVGHKLAGKTLGIIGYGRIGRQVGKIAKAMGMKVLWHDYNDGDELPYLLRDSDFISVHVPLKGNEGGINNFVFKFMKKTAFLINTSRDGVIAKGALLWALENKLIAGAAIDFADDENLVEYSRSHDNLIITPHIGGATIEDRQLTKDFIIKKIDALCQDLQ